MRNKILSIAAVIAFATMGCAKERFINQPGNLVPKTAEEDPAVPSAMINGARLHTEASGQPDSTIVVFLHGGPGGDYRSLINGKQLAAHGYRVVFYDQRGSGLSQRFPKKSYTSRGHGAIELMYQELDAVIAHYRTSPSQKVYLVGHSWGAILATGYAGSRPGKVQGLVVAEPGGLKWADIKEYVKKSRQFSLWSELANDAAYLDQFVAGKEDQHAILDYKAAMLVAKNDIAGEYNTEPSSFWRSGAVINTAFFEIGEDHQPDFSSGIDGFGKPVLFLYSSQNKAYTDAWATRISASYPSVVLRKVNGVGHGGIFYEQSAWTAITMPRILEYFNSL